jgi:hypothetical protein
MVTMSSALSSSSEVRMRFSRSVCCATFLAGAGALATAVTGFFAAGFFAATFFATGFLAASFFAAGLAAVFLTVGLAVFLADFAPVAGFFAGFLADFRGIRPLQSGGQV